jgi:hypothetical protein
MALVAAASLASLLTVPELPTSATRLEAFVALALVHGDERERLSPELVTDIFTREIPAFGPVFLASP